MSNKRYILPNYQGGINGDVEELQPRLRFLYEPVNGQEDPHPLDAQLLYVTTAKYEHDWHSTVHAHPFSELFYISGGKGSFFAKGDSFEIEKNHLVIINPQVDHAEFSSEDQPLEYIVLGIDGLQFSSTTPEKDMAVIHITNTDRKICQYMEDLREEIQSHNLGRDAMCQNLLNMLLVLILRHKDIQVEITAPSNVSTQCTTVKDYIDAHFKEPLTLEMLASEAHQNKYYVAHTFKAAYGLSPIKYLMKRRVEESKFLLEDTDYSVGQIAYIIGFSSASHFSQAFRREAEMTPNEYRKKARARGRGV